MSLKDKIYYYLEKNGHLTLQELESLCKSEMKKLSNGERRLRELMASNPAIKPEKNPHGAIIAYTWNPIQIYVNQNPTPKPAELHHIAQEFLNKWVNRVEEKVEQRLF